MTTTTTIQDRAKGVLLGIAAGDRNGGPIRMAVRLGESLNERGGFEREDVVKRYLAWFRGPPHDAERAFDTGTTFAAVMRRHAAGEEIGRASEAVQRETGGAGINAAHRNSVLASARVIGDGAELVQAAEREARITHANGQSVSASVVVNVLVRGLVRGGSWESSLEAAREAAEQRRGPVSEVFTTERPLERGGFAPDVLRAAIHFVSRASTFDESVDWSVAFAGSPNFCPVLVGAIAGARWGATSISSHQLRHCEPTLLDRVIRVSSALGSSWV